MNTNTLKVLMLEDSDIDAEMIQRTLRKSELQCEFKVMMTREAFERSLQEFKPDLILSDNAMPQFSASEALEVVQQLALHVPFILVTGTVSEEFAASIIKAGADDYLLKDRLTRLPAAIEVALKQKQNKREKKEASEKLQQSEEKYRSLTERVTDGFVALDKNWNYTYVNKQAGEILKRNPDELLGKNIWTEFPEGVEQPFYKVYHKAFNEQRYIHFEEYYAPFNFWLENHIYPSQDGMSIYFRDVTEKKKAEALLKEERDKFAKIATTSPGLIYSMRQNKDGALSYPYASDAIKEIYGFVFEEIQDSPNKIFELIHPDDVTVVMASIQETKTNMVPLKGEYRYYHPTKGLIWHEVNSLPATEPGGDVVCHGIVMDITERKNAEQKIVKANRLYFFISQINQMIVRTTDEKTLFAEICTIAVEVGKFRMAWVGMIDEQTEKVVPVMHAGHEQEYLSVIKQISISDTPEGRGPTGTAIRHNEYTICNDIENDPYMGPWKEAALQRGYRSSMSLPVKKFGAVIGSFSVYASETNFFDAEEIALLEEAAGDVSFALEVFEKEKQRQKAEAAVLKSEQRYHTLTDVSPVGIFHTDAKGSTIYVNPRWCQISGLSFEEGLDYGWLDAVHEEDKTELVKGWQKATGIQEFSTSEYRFVRPDGSVTWVLGQATPERNDLNEVVGYVGTVTDITERKKAEEEIKLVNQRFEIIAAATNDAVFEVDLLTGVSSHNKAFIELLNFGSGSAGTDNRSVWRSKLHPDDSERVIKKLEATYAGTATTWSDEFRFKKADGSYGIFYDRASIVRDDSGKAVRFLGSMVEITELKKAEEAIKKSNERFELIAKATNDALWDWNLETNQLWANEMHNKLLGITKEDPPSNYDDWQKRIHPEDRQRTLQALQYARENGKNILVDEYRFYVPDLGWLHIYGQTLIQRDANGNVVRLIGSMKDITERKKAEELLVANEKRFRKLVENANDAFAIIDAAGKPSYISSSVKRVLGYTEEEMYNMEMLSIVHPDNVLDVQQTLQKVMENPGVPFTSHLSRLLHKDGTYHWFEDTITNFFDDPDIGGIVDNFRDVTERVNSQQALMESEEKHRDIVENITDIICTHELDGKALSVNATAKKSLGYEIGDMLNMKVQDVLLPYSKERFADYISSIRQNGFARGLMYVQTKTGENRIWEFRNTLRTIEGKAPFVYGFAQDVTERIEGEEKLKDKNAQLQTLSDNLPGIMLYQLLGKRDGIKKFTYLSNGISSITGNTPEEVIENPDLLYNRIYKEDMARLIAAEKVALLNMSVLNIEIQCRTYKDDIRWLNIISTPRKLDSGQIVWDGFHLDITERKKAEDILRESEETFSKIFYLNPSVCAINDLQDDKFTDVNEAFVKYFGFTKEEVIGKTSVELGILKAGIRNGIIDKMDEHGIVHNVETSVTTKQGENKDTLLSTSNIYIHKKEYAYTVLNDITERKKAEAAIQASEEQYRTLVEQATDGIFIADSTGKFIIVNTSACRLAGYTAAEFKELTIYDLVDPQSLISNPFHFEEMHNPQGARTERKMVCKDGKLIDVEISAKFLSDKRFIAFVRDIGDRLKAEQAIRLSEERYRVLVEEASEGIYISDATGRFTTVNASACKIAQYSEAELLQMTIYDFFIEKDLAQNPPQFEALRQGKTVIAERIMKRRDGNINHLEITSKLLSDGRLLSLVRDVAERKKAEQALLASEEKYRSLVEQASDAIFIADTEGRFITVNTSASKLSGYTEAELMQMTIYDFVIEEDIKKRAFRFEELKQGLTTLTERVMQARGGKPIHVEITSKLLSDGRLLSFVRDISERIKAQNEIIKEKNLSDSIINSLPASFFMINSEGKILRWNKHLERASKYSAEEIKDMHPLEFFVEVDKPAIIEKITNVFLAGEDSMEAVVALKTKELVPYYFKGISIEYDGMPCIMGVGIDISERVKAQEEIKLTNEKLRELTNHLLNVREEERKRIGREIHDELGQQLTAIKMDVSWIDKKTPGETILIKNKLKNIITLLDGSNLSIRRILSELRPGILDDNGLLEALEWLNRQFTAQTGIPVEFETRETELKLPEPVSTCIFRVYQETFTNITRYAKASKVLASLNINNGTICVTVQDDGRGFDIKAAQNKKSFGILGMRERIMSLNGNFQLITEPGKGTKIVIVLPLIV